MSCVNTNVLFVTTSRNINNVCVSERERIMVKTECQAQTKMRVCNNTQRWLCDWFALCKCICKSEEFRKSCSDCIYVCFSSSCSDVNVQSLFLFVGDQKLIHSWNIKCEWRILLQIQLYCKCFVSFDTVDFQHAMHQFIFQNAMHSFLFRTHVFESKTLQASYCGHHNICNLASQSVVSYY